MRLMNRDNNVKCCDTSCKSAIKMPSLLNAFIICTWCQYLFQLINNIVKQTGNIHYFFCNDPKKTIILTFTGQNCDLT